jgi:hypothetical protein
MHLLSLSNLNGCKMIKFTVPHSNLTSLPSKPYAHVPRAQLWYIV